jgi:hypothetical protein
MFTDNLEGHLWCCIFSVARGSHLQGDTCWLAFSFFAKKFISRNAKRCKTDGNFAKFLLFLWSRRHTKFCFESFAKHKSEISFREEKSKKCVQLLHFSHFHAASLVQWVNPLLPATGGSGSRPGGAPTLLELGSRYNSFSSRKRICP